MLVTVKGILKKVEFTNEPPEEQHVEPDGELLPPLQDPVPGLADLEPRPFQLWCSVLGTSPLAKVVETFDVFGWAQIVVVCFSFDEPEVVQCLIDYRLETGGPVAKDVIIDKSQTVSSRGQNSK